MMHRIQSKKKPQSSCLKCNFFAQNQTDHTYEVLQFSQVFGLIFDDEQCSKFLKEPLLLATVLGCAFKTFGRAISHFLN